MPDFALRRVVARIAALGPPPTILVAGLSIAVTIVVLRTFWHETNGDLIVALLPWYDVLHRQGFAAFATGFSNYTPPYLYLLSLGTLADGLAAPTTIIRAVSVACNVVAAAWVFRLAQSWGWTHGRALLVAFVFLLLPEMVVNSAVWAQCDIIYTLFLMAFVCCVIARQGWAATAMLGIAFAFKMQAGLIGPFVLYLLLSRQLQWRQLVMVPAMYLLLMLPAALAGRPWGDLLTIYVGQFEYYPLLSMSAPNPYLLVRAVLSDTPEVYAVGTLVGLLLGCATAVALVVAFLRDGGGPRRERLLLMATLTLAAMPYVLPKMHERYFFPASAMAFLLALARPRTWPIVVLIQLADLCAYARFLHATTSHAWLGLGAALMTAAIAGMVRLQMAPSPDGRGCITPKRETITTANRMILR